MKVKPHDYIKWCRKAFDKTQYPFMILLAILELPQLDKEHLKNLQAKTIILNGEKRHAVPVSSEKDKNLSSHHLY